MTVVKHETIEYTTAEMNRLLAVKREFENLLRITTDPKLKEVADEIAGDLAYFIQKFTDISLEDTVNECSNVQMNCDGTKGPYD